MLKDTRIELSESTSSFRDKTSVAGQFVLSENKVYLGEKHSYIIADAQGNIIRDEQGEPVREDVLFSNLESTAMHEIGHAVDHHNGWELSDDLEADAFLALNRMTDQQKEDSKYWFTKRNMNVGGVYTPDGSVIGGRVRPVHAELFAELYSAAYNPVDVGPTAPGYASLPVTYFGGLSRTETERIFAEALAKVRAKRLTHAVVRAVGKDGSDEDLLENGWLVTSDGSVYAIINGSPYKVIATDTPLADLPPGDYTDEQVRETLRKRDYKPKWLRDLLTKQHHSQTQDRDEQGRFADQGGGDDGGGSAAARPRFTADDFRKPDLYLGSGLGGGETERVVNVWNEHIGMAPEQFKKLFMGGVNGSMAIGMSQTPGRENGLSITGILTDENDDDDIGSYHTDIDFDRKVAEGINLGYRGKEQGKNHANRLVMGQIMTFKQLGMERLDTYANIDVGGYAWARYGMIPTERGWPDLSETMINDLENGYRWTRGVGGKEPRRIDLSVIPDADRAALMKLIDSPNPRTLWAVADSKYGKDLLIGSDWEGSVLLNDQDTLNRFNAYLSRPRRR
jgi:hypothetical protein